MICGWFLSVFVKRMFLCRRCLFLIPFMCVERKFEFLVVQRVHLAYENRYNGSFGRGLFVIETLSFLNVRKFKDFRGSI